MDDEKKYDWLVCRLWGKVTEKIEICLLSTRGFMLARHIKKHIRENLANIGEKGFKPIAGLRRYRTEKRANEKADTLNKKFKCTGYKSVREDKI